MSKPKIVAFHLPQYHCFKENDEWWGKGFTEWTNTKSAKPLYKGHYQPKTPMDNKYYNMLDEETRLWQYDLAKKHGVDAFCYYHYWFDGKLLMEKPLELALNDKTDFPFFLCWANEPWTRAWDGGDKEVIMPQVYRGEPDWEAHFNYLLPFFKLDRYVKIDGAPVFVLYRSNNIPRCEEMIEYWDKKCKEAGFNGVYVIEEYNCFQTQTVTNNSKAVLKFEPMYSMGKRNFFNKVADKIRNKLKNAKNKTNCSWRNYDQVWKLSLKHDEKTDKTLFYGGFVDFDNTARKKKNGMIFYNASIEKFKKYLSKQMRLAEKNNAEFLFLNAWNEWAEGAYLEPDDKRGYALLTAVKEVVDGKN